MSGRSKGAKKTTTAAAPVCLDPADPDAPAWVRTLRWEDAPDVLLPEQAAILLRGGVDLIYEIIHEQRIQAESGMDVPNPFPAWRRGQPGSPNARIRIPSSDLRDWLSREAVSWINSFQGPGKAEASR